MSRVTALKREGYKSRQSEKKHEVYLKGKEKMKKAITLEQAINSHLVNTSFSNYRKCVSCESNYGESFAREINFNDEKDTQFCLRSRPNLMRFQKYFVCSNCESNLDGDVQNEVEGSNLVKIEEVREGNKITFKPQFAGEAGEDVLRDNNVLAQAEAGQDDGNIQETSLVAVQFPNSVACVKENSNFKVSTDVNPNKTFLRCEEISKKLISECYTVHYLKYSSIVKFSKRFTGRVEDVGNKVIGGLTQIADDSHIHGSLKWNEKKLSEMRARIDQTGNSFLKVKIKIEQLDEESKATALLVSGKTITCSFDGDEGMLLNRQYHIHPSHDCDTPCPANCQVVPLIQYLEENRDVINSCSARWISVFNSTVYLKLNSLIKNIFGCVNYQMYSEEMTFSLIFNQQGHAVIVGALWTKSSEEFNKELSNSSYTGQINKAVRSEYLCHLDDCLTSTANISELMEQFRLTFEDASKLSRLAGKYQAMDDEERDLEMPSLETMFREVPDQVAMHNIFESRELMKILRLNLQGKSNEEIDDMTTEEWLQDLDDYHIVVNQSDDGSMIEIDVENRALSFYLDRRLSRLIVQYEDYPFIGIYHYALTCVSYDNSDSIVLKRRNLVDCFVRTYNPALLTVMQSRADITPVHGYRDWEHLSITQQERNQPPHDPEVFSHDVISLNEVANLMTNRRPTGQHSRPTVFVNSNKDAKILFKKVFARTDQTFTAQDQTGHFEMQNNSCMRFKMRKNGEDIIQAEFSCWFEFVGSEESAIQFNIFGENLDKIPQSKVTSPLTGQLYPSLICCSNGDVMRIRKQKQILMSPR